ncbi:MAG TPA: stage II sporulation protein R [Tissierellia bacterium]|nr:stage II sporulation protein R [Tissierellia bacterium]
MKYKKLIVSLVLIISIIYILNFYLTAQEAYMDDIRDEIIRFHVKANSDSKEDQDLKLKVRDRILKETRDLLKESTSIDETRSIMKDNLDNIKSIAKEVLEEEGKDYDVDVTFGIQKFPTRKYGDLVFPAGEYETLMVKIGEGKGQNWWCVMFPPLCFVDMANNTPHAQEDLMAVLSEEEVNMLLAEKNPPIILKSKILELFEKTRNFIANKLAKLN